MDQAAAAWETLDDDTLRLIVSKRRTAHFRALLINVCKTWHAAILQNTFADLEPFLHKLDRRKLVEVLRLAWTRPASIRSALSAAVGNVWTSARPPALADKRTWLATQILKNNWVETRQQGMHYTASWAPHRLRFTRGEVSITHALDNWECPRVDNEDWANIQYQQYSCLEVDGDKVQELNMCESGCDSDSISLTLNENLAGELQLVLTTISTCMCNQDFGYGGHEEAFEEVATYALVDDDEDEVSEEEGEDEDEGSKEDEDEDEDEGEGESEGESESEGEGEEELAAN